MDRDQESGSLRPAGTVTDLVARYPELSSLGHIDTLTLFNIDSTNVRPSHWLSLAAVVDANRRRYNGVIITHGTDTLVYTASALAFMLQNPGIPIVLTGSQLPGGQLASDARNNLVNAFRVACQDIPEVLIVFGSRVLRGVRSRKLSVFDFEAFQTVNETPVGTIGLGIRLHGVIRRNRKRYNFRPGFCEDVFALKIFPGMRAGTLLALLDQGFRGVFIEGFGTGNVPAGDYSIIPEIREASRRGIPVVIGTQCVFGEVDLTSYEVGRLASDVGAIPAFDMTPEAAIVKLMWTLAQSSDPQEIRRIFLDDVAGEMEKVPSRKAGRTRV